MSDLKTIDIKGKEYVMVNERIMYFRNNMEGQIITEILSNEDGVCIFKASIIVNDKVVATGHAYEKEGSTFINKTSYVENCETSAIGRALGILGIGIETSVASYEEVANAIKQQEQPEAIKEENTSAFFEKELDQCEFLEDAEAWATANKGRIAESLNKTEKAKLTRYYKGILEVLPSKNETTGKDAPLFQEK